MFPTEKLRDEFGPYFEYLKTAKYFDDKMDDCMYGVHPFNVVSFSERYGKKYNAIAAKNEKLFHLIENEPTKLRNMFGHRNNNLVETEEQQMRNMFGHNNVFQSGGLIEEVANQEPNNELPPREPNVANNLNLYVPGQGSTYIVRESEYAIAEILYGLMKLKKSVLYIPETSTPEYIRSIRRCLEDPKYSRIEFAFVNASKDIRDTFFFQSQVDYTQPILFRPGSIQLLQLLRISENMASLAKLFKNGYQFLSRIRTHYLMPVRENGQLQAGGDSKNVELSFASEDALNVLYGDKTPQIGGKKRQTRRRPKQRKQNQRKYKTRKH
jgi:hypothetical protein